MILQFAFTNVQVSDWGQTGHRVIGLVAEQHLTQKTKAAVDNLLQGESLRLSLLTEMKSDLSKSSNILILGTMLICL
ncbi:MAG: hypothetical protein CM15mP83_0460 [Flavobacteriaceae bacterium]|nr:MAG: hypothetical protein CM15mP83_0460 [Flavobacteriaceae bacterium]